MPKTRSAMKRLRQNEKRWLRNQTYRSRARTFIRKARRLIEEGRLDEAQIAVSEAASTLDRAAVKGIIHKNNAARRKSRLMKRLNQALAAAQAETRSA